MSSLACTMSNQVKVKICGLSDPEDVAYAADAGADYLGFVFFPKSPRNVAAGRVGDLVGAARQAITVALLVNPNDQDIETVLTGAPFGMIQLHGSESPERVREIRETFSVPVMKALGIKDRTDLDAIVEHSEAADQLLVDAKAAPGAMLPGGSGVRFDWHLIRDCNWKLPWMLAGGLNPGNVADALRETGARQVDVSTGVETAPGRKDQARIGEFINAAKGR